MRTIQPEIYKGVHLGKQYSIKTGYVSITLESSLMPHPNQPPPQRQRLFWILSHLHFLTVRTIVPWDYPSGYLTLTPVLLATMRPYCVSSQHILSSSQQGPPREARHNGLTSLLPVYSGTARTTLRGMEEQSLRSRCTFCGSDEKRYWELTKVNAHRQGRWASVTWIHFSKGKELPLPREIGPRILVLSFLYTSYIWT